MKRKHGIGPNIYNLQQKKVKEEKCIACNGSGRYDHQGSPKCSSCEGTGKIPIDTNIESV